MTFTNGYRIVRGTCTGHTHYVVKRGESLVQCTGDLRVALGCVR